MTITIRPRWSLGRGKTLVPSRWPATHRSSTALADCLGDQLVNHLSSSAGGHPGHAAGRPTSERRPRILPSCRESSPSRFRGSWSR
jgi:hypothetical protein